MELRRHTRCETNTGFALVYREFYMSSVATRGHTTRRIKHNKHTLSILQTHKRLQAVVIFLSCFKQLFQGLFQPPIHQPSLVSIPFILLLLLLPSLISPRMKVTFLSLHPSTRTPPRCGLTAAHSRQCQAEIILSVKLSNEARDTDTLKNKRTLELWESTLAFEEWWGEVGRIKWMKWAVFISMLRFMACVSSNICRLPVRVPSTSFDLLVKFPFCSNTD